MAYKTRYRPLEALGPAGWTRLEDMETVPAAPLEAAVLA